MSAHRRSGRPEEEREIEVDLNHFPVLESPTTISCKIEFRRSGRDVFVGASVQKLIATTYLHKSWRASDVLPLAIPLQQTLYNNGQFMTAPVVRGVAEYIKLQARQDPQDPETAYWNTILSEDQEWKTFVDAFDNYTKTFGRPRPPICFPPHMSYPSASIQSLLQKHVPKIDPKYEGRISIRPKASTYELFLTDRELDLGPHGQKLLMCMVFHMQSPLKDVVEPLETTTGIKNRYLTALVCGQFARYILDRSRTQQTGPEHDHWKIILCNEQAWSDYAKSFNRATKRFLNAKPSLAPAVANPRENIHDPLSQTQIPTLQRHSTSQQTPGHIYNPYADPRYQPPPEQYDCDEFGNLVSHLTSMPPPQAARAPPPPQAARALPPPQAARAPPPTHAARTLPTGTDTITAFESARILSRPGIGFHVTLLAARDDAQYHRINAEPEHDTYTITYLIGERRPHRLDEYGQKLIISTILHLKWKPLDVAEALQEMERRGSRSRIWTGRLINQIALYIYDQSLDHHKAYKEKIHWTSIMFNDPAWTRYVSHFEQFQRFPNEKPEIERKLPIPAPEPVASSSSSVANTSFNTYNPASQTQTHRLESRTHRGLDESGGRNTLMTATTTAASNLSLGPPNPLTATSNRSVGPPNPLSHRQTGPPSPPRIQNNHKLYVTVEYASALRKHYKVLPEEFVESGFKMDSRNPVHQWDIPKEHIGLPMPVLDKDGLLDMKFDDPFVISNKRARDSASLSQSPERGASASPDPRPNQGDVRSGSSHRAQGSSGHSSRREEPRREHTKRPEKQRRRH
ncbi:hypothetical protein G7Y79_00007g022200 [Physcia stellaris]|nr:hypothetical protein G7Y79_00007g022200 [Physcia stellaris]